MLFLNLKMKHKNSVFLEKKVFQPAFGWAQHPKAGRNKQHISKQFLDFMQQTTLNFFGNLGYFAVQSSSRSRQPLQWREGSNCFITPKKTQYRMCNPTILAKKIWNFSLELWNGLKLTLLKQLILTWSNLICIKT